MSDPSSPAADPPYASAESLPALPKPEEISSLSQLFGVLKGRFDLDTELAELRSDRDDWGGDVERASDLEAGGD
ncbi:hypothetical protein [Alienimonas chondri]|uniref:Uncharacterized protein n=1 Tax=Alienimonas chondri TaxID=2681879 RepID=A0ABX1VA16_9PLAN|nr:hypothetical protein [Alienimonas chondri]NNJ24350.1 hypothetical protein [Alienimonas chondri]